MIGLLNYDAGNLTSVEAALRHLGLSYSLIDRPEQMIGCEKIIVPGVGEARAAMDILKARGLGEGLKNFAATGRPLFGICLGSQIILDHSEERDTPCLALLPGECKSFRATFDRQHVDRIEFKVPHIGWNQVEPARSSRLAAALFAGIPQGSSFYFDHGYYTEPAQAAAVLGQSEHGIRFASAIGWDNIVAVQFHPEKSGIYGLRLLENFVKNF